MKVAIRILVVVALVALIWVLRVTVFAPKPPHVLVYTAAAGRVEDTVANSKAGTIRARRRAELSTGTSGIVEELHVHRGDHVKAGDVLLKLEDSTQAAALALSDRDLTVAQATLERTCLSADRARREHDRYQELSNGIVSADRLDALESAMQVADADCRVARAQVDRATAAIDVARADLDKTVLHAPFDAIVAEVDCELGEWVTPSVPLVAAPPLIDAIDPSSLYVSAPMDEVDAGKLKVGLPTRVTIDPYPDQVFPGKIARVAPYVVDVEQQNRTLEIEVELDDVDFSATLLPGTTADVEVVLETRDDVLRVPSLALLEGGKVLVVADGVLQERQLELGLRNWRWSQVLSGLEAGDRIVSTLDRDGVKAGVRVVVDGEDTEAGK